MKLKSLILTALCAVGLVFPSVSHAAGALSARLGQPKSPTNQNSLKLTFVVLEIGGSDNIAVSCYKKSPSDSGFVKFQDITLIPGGNTDYCSVNNSILSNAGTYSFKIIANGIKESNIVSVDYNTAGPSTPGSYSKERVNSCDYKIKFKTADDGRTVKVELYRSDVSPISIDSGHLVATQNISPNTEGSFTNSVPTCGKDYYFALRAVDGADNVSGVVGDSSTTVITESTTTTSTTTNQGAIPVTSGSQVTKEGEPTETVSPSTSITPAESQPASTASQVLGTSTDRFKNLKWLAIPLLIVAALFFKKARKHS